MEGSIMSIRRISFLTLVLLALMAVAVPAAAVSPTTETFEYVDEFVDEESCDFPVEVSFVGGGTERTFYNEDGTVKKVIVSLSDEGTFTNPETGASVSGDNAWTVVIDFEDGEPTTESYFGLVFHFNVPGGGIVLIDAGRVVFDVATGEVIVVSGPHQALEGDFSALCAALG
jgi:hypothetical protein